MMSSDERGAEQSNVSFLPLSLQNKKSFELHDSTLTLCQSQHFFFAQFNLFIRGMMHSLKKMVRSNSVRFPFYISPK
jgi:hypothetical protein